jgi:hypothetical protein
MEEDAGEEVRMESLSDLRLNRFVSARIPSSVAVKLWQRAFCVKPVSIFL